MPSSPPYQRIERHVHNAWRNLAIARDLAAGMCLYGTEEDLFHLLVELERVQSALISNPQKRATGAAVRACP